MVSRVIGNYCLPTINNHIYIYIYMATLSPVVVVYNSNRFHVLERVA